MLVLQGTTPDETKASILEFLEHEAERHTRSAPHNRLKVEQACDRARANALRAAITMLSGCVLADLKAIKTH